MRNVAIIGTGNICPNHVDGLLTFPDRARIVALVDIYPEKAQAMKERFHLDCQVFDSTDALLASDVQFDLVHICTPPYTHAPIAIQMMNAKKCVVVEKPMATCLRECDEMLEAEKRNGVTMACIAQNRFRNSVNKLKTLADEEALGKIRVAHVNSLWWRGHSYYDLWWRGLWEKEGGGPTLNHAVHHIDMINWIKKGLPKQVIAMLANVMHDNSEVEDVSMASLKYEDGSVAQLIASVVHFGEEQGIVLQCENGKIAAPWDCKISKSQPNGFPEDDPKAVEEMNRRYEALPELPYEGHVGEIDNILTALEQGTRPMITGIDGRNTVELITAIYKAGCTQQAVNLPIEKDDEFYEFEGLLKHAIHFNHKSASVENLPTGNITVGNYQ